MIVSPTLFLYQMCVFGFCGRSIKPSLFRLFIGVLGAEGAGEACPKFQLPDLYLTFLWEQPSVFHPA